MISTNLERLQANNARIKRNIENAYIEAKEKGASLPSVQNSGSLADTVRSIPQMTDKWEPEADWFDIDTILKEDRENYATKMIVLLSNSYLRTTIYGWGASKIRTSDGVEYRNNVATVSHEWNVEYDKECSLGYKTRYIVYYFEDADVTSFWGNARIPIDGLYCIFKNMNITITNDNGDNNIFSNCVELEYVKCVNTMFEHHPAFWNCSNLCGVEGLNYKRFKINGLYNGSFKLKETYIKNDVEFTDAARVLCGTKLIEYVDIDFSRVTNFMNAFWSSSIKYINVLDFNCATNVQNMFYQASDLRSIKNVFNIKISGIDFGACVLLNRDTLLRIIDALYDYSEDTEGVHIIKFGTVLLAKLTEEEIAEITQKGWTVS